MWPSLRQQQRTRCGIKARKMQLERALYAAGAVPTAERRQWTAVPARQNGEAGGASAALARAKRQVRGLVQKRGRASSCPRAKSAGALEGSRNSSHAACRSDTDASRRSSSSCESRLRHNSCWTKALLPSGAPRTRIPCWEKGKDQALVQIVPRTGVFASYRLV